MARTNLPLSAAGVLLGEGPLYNAPVAPVPTTAATGGTVAAGTYLVVVSYVTPLGETIGSPVGSIVTAGTTSTITVPSPAAANLGPASPNFSAYTGWYAYVTQVGGSSFTRQQAAGSPTPIGTSLLISAPPTSTGVAPTLTDPAGSTIDQVNGMNIAFPTTGSPIPPPYDAYRGLLLRVKNTGASAANLLVRAGAYPPAMRAFLGDLVVNVPAAGTFWVGPLDMARHAQIDDSINVDFAAGFAGTITALALPRNIPGNP